MRSYFILGRSGSSEVDESLAEEKASYKDIWLGNFTDNYKRLTDKLIISFDDAVRHTQFAYLMLTDDDSFVNAPALLHWLVRQKRQLFFGGDLVRFGRVRRDRQSKWFVDNATFAEKTFPPYMYGSGYVVSRDVAEVLGNRSSYSLKLRNLWIDDVVAGIVIKEHFPELKAVNSPFFYGFLHFSPSSCQGVHAHMIGNVPILKMVAFDQNLRKGRSLC